MPPLKLLAATRNKGKIRELTDLLSGRGFEIVGLDDLGILDDVEETGATFAENAELKASTYARLAGIMTLSDDSGLEIAALGGAPGVLSARYAGEGASDSERIEKVLGEMAGSGDRDARFVCAISVANADGAIIRTVIGTCEGSIGLKPRGERGFGYDPIFVPVGRSKSFGELTDAEKSTISHRSAAVAAIMELFRTIIRA